MTLGPSPSSRSGGGAIWAGGESSLVLRNCGLYNNSATASGGAVFSLGGVTVLNSELASNSAGVGGGALYVGGALTVNTTLLAGNNATSRGGAVEAGRGNVTLFNVTFARNNALIGEGGALMSNGFVLADSVTVLNNLAATDGGGFFLNQGLTLRTSSGLGPTTSFVGNRVIASRGGALFVNGSTSRVSISDAIFTSNLAYYVGGGLYFSSPNTTLRRVWVTNNFVRGAFPYAGGIAAEVLGHGTMTLDECLVDGNAVTRTSGAEAASSKAFAQDSVNLLGQLKGGGLYVVCPPGVTFRVVITGSRFNRNQAESGSFLAAPGSGSVELSVSRTDFIGNVASLEGGAYLGDNVRRTHL